MNMNNKQLIIIVIAIIIAGCIIAGAIAYTFKPLEQVNATVNITENNNTTNITESRSEDVVSSESKQEDSGVIYDAYGLPYDKKTGEFLGGPNHQMSGGNYYRDACKHGVLGVCDLCEQGL